MHGWILPLLMVIAAGILIFLCLIRRFCCFKNPKQPPPDTPNGTNKKRTNYYIFQRGGISSKPLFSWSYNPSLVTDAVENGWSRFSFTNYVSSPSVRSTSLLILGSCASTDAGDDHVEVDISWEVCQGSADFMQKIQFNSRLKKINTKNSSSMAAVSVIKSALPLPGPPLGNSSSFPQEAYFEITILSGDADYSDLVDKVKVAEKIQGEMAKLIQESPNAEAKSESLVHISNENSHFVGEMRDGSDKDHHGGRKGGVVEFSIGLSGGGSLPLRLPGSYPGSIGFNSNGCVFLDGTKLMTETEKKEWGRGEKVIGCGYNPSQKRVFFTVDSQLIHEIHCKTEDFGAPLYPTLASNIDIIVLVNFGQSVFKYAPANLERTPNPCFIGPLGNTPVLGYEDSKELFSMGRIDSHWLDRRSLMLHTPSNNKNGADFDEVSDADLFEIVLDVNSTGRSPYTPS